LSLDRDLVTRAQDIDHQITTILTNRDVGEMDSLTQHQCVVTTRIINGVLAITAVEEINIFAASTTQRIVAFTAGELVRAVIARQRIVIVRPD